MFEGRVLPPRIKTGTDSLSSIGGLGLCGGALDDALLSNEDQCPPMISVHVDKCARK